MDYYVLPATHLFDKEYLNAFSSESLLSNSLERKTYRLTQHFLIHEIGKNEKKFLKTPYIALQLLTATLLYYYPWLMTWPKKSWWKVATQLSL